MDETVYFLYRMERVQFIILWPQKSASEIPKIATIIPKNVLKAMKNEKLKIKYS